MVSNSIAATTTEQAEETQSSWSMVGLVLGPALAVGLWFAPLALAPNIKHALAIVTLMIVYWVFEPIEHGLTGLLGCYLFWALGIVKFETAFAGFADSTPWFLFGAMLMGEAAARSGVAVRLGFIVMRLIGTSYSRLLLSVVVIVLILNFLVPSGLAQISIVAPMILGVMVAFGVGKGSNIGRGMFVLLSCICGLFNKMILAGGASILTRGLVEKLTGYQISWGQYFVAYLPGTLITVIASWLAVLWLYPPEKKELPGGRAYLNDALAAMGPWTAVEKKTMAWLMLAVVLWSTDFVHHMNPAVITMGIGLMVALPKIGVLKTKDVRSVNYLLIVFLGSALSMGEVLIRTKALDTLTDTMMSWMTPLLGQTSFQASNVVFWTAFLFHFPLASELSMLSTSLPVIIHFAQTHGYNPVTFAMLWNFSTGGKLFVYQSSVLILGYSYGYFDARDMLKVGAVLTVVQGLILILLVPLYWPLIGLSCMAVK